LHLVSSGPCCLCRLARRCIASMLKVM
jgi:hypothetical protein